ncbi:hypothetical protein EON66_01640 [archaeon]|nr:MAG: hypothetical protein EON66_01640 [archaeon]
MHACACSCAGFVANVPHLRYAAAGEVALPSARCTIATPLHPASLSPPCHAGMTFVTTSCIRQGTTVVTLPKFDPMLFLQTLQKHKITYAPLVCT